MPAKPRWLLAVPDAVRQLEKLDRDLVTRRDLERLFGVSRARAAQLMREFGAELAGSSRVLRRADLLRQLKRLRGRAAFRIETERRTRVLAELRQARLTGIRVAVPVESLEARLGGLPEGVTVEPGPDRGAVRGGEGGRGEALRAGPGADGRLRALRDARREGGDVGMSEALVPAPPAGRAEVAPRGGAAVALPAVIVDAGPAAVERFLEFFAAAVANDRTRAAYGRAAGRFLAWCGARGLGLRAIAPLHVAAYIRTHPGSVPTVKQHLAAIRALCDWLVVHQVLPANPAAAVRGPKHVVTKGATPVLTPAETRELLDRIDTGTVVGLRDRALLSVMVYSFARVSAVVGMRRQDYFRQERRGWLRLHEKGGKRHDVPAHHRAEEAVEAYLVAVGLERRRREGAAVSERRPGGLAERSGARAPGRAGDDQAAGGGRGAAGVDVLPHVSRDGHHGVPVERGNARARAADRRPRVAEDDEAVRPDGGRDHARRDRTHRDLGEA